MSNKEVWLQIFQDLKSQGKVSAPRGQKIIEILDYKIQFHPIDNRFCSFKERKLSLSYNFAEWAWYVSGNRNDTRMESYASFWKTIKNEVPPFYNSNYGHYFFQENQFDYVFESLKADKDSRQACIVLNKSHVMLSTSKDKICTYAITFNIRENKLNMIVNMRSNDVISGTSIDANMFSFLYEYLYVKLLEIYPDLEIGIYTHKADSFHIYERNFEIMEGILRTNGENYTEVKCPRITSVKEVDFMLKYYPMLEEGIRLKVKPDEGIGMINIPKEFDFTYFLLNQIKKRWK